ncbi:hypothetical protein [Endozoicomonas sp. YOMI1]|uniref:hypothetical protein n=1 Tax=Endozoicomonas sp. YOMI1 TaxID=2828739 RepID=UPI0021487466|nr:hypothetical protein [Endozoicomonas sp. YOMI1]
MSAAAGLQIQQPTGYRRCVNLIRISINDLIEAAATTAITVRLSIKFCHVILPHRMAVKWFECHCALSRHSFFSVALS